MTIRQLLASAARFLGLAPRPTPPHITTLPSWNGGRHAARRAGLAYWVEGPKADGLFWLYHRKTPDDLAEPVRGYTRRRNAQAAAVRQ